MLNRDLTGGRLAGPRPSRRGLLAGAAGLVIAVHLPRAARAQEPVVKALHTEPNAFLRIAPDDTVTVLVKHIEFGQGPWTGLATLVAEELDADWTQMRAAHAPHDAVVYANTLMGMQLTGGSTAIANSYEQMRKVGATARAMLVAAAAARWGVPAAEITVTRGVIAHPSGRSGRFGAFAEAAARLPLPADVTLKDPAAFRLIGTDLPKLDTPMKSRGEARYTIDERAEGMLVAVVAHPPRFGGRVRSVDDAEARRIEGVVDVKVIPQGVAVFARSTWPALKARDALKVTWDEGEAWTRGTTAMVAEYEARSASPGDVAKRRGDAAAALAKASGVVEQVFVFPYLAHAAMEPLDGVMRFDGTRAHALYGSQAPTIDAGAIASVLGIEPSAVSIDVALAGGSFGRRAQQDGSFAAEAAACAKVAPRGTPVKLVWTREDDMRGGKYRPLYVHRLRGALAPDGSIAAWHHTIVGQSIGKGTPLEKFLLKDGIDETSHEGASDLPYRIADFQCDVHTTDAAVPVLWWRSVGHTHTGYATETFLDVLLERGGKDPVEGRLALLAGGDPRYAGVLRAVADLAAWKATKAGEGRARGVAVHKSFNTYVAQVAEVSRGPDGFPKVHKVWCAVDCGVAVNPNVIRAQIESGVGFGLGHALFAEIELGADGQVVQGNFDTYRSLRIGEMPEVETVIVKSSEKPTGIGEPGVPPTAPAVANAWRALTGQVIARLPFTRQTMV